MKPLRISPQFYQLLPAGLQSQLEMFYLADTKFWHGYGPVSFPRYGQSKLWDFYIDRDCVFSPGLNQSTDKSFEEISDQRAIEIKHAMQQHNRELAVFWSGGIDSTVILTSIIKNFTPDELSNVTVIANNQSYFENPIFYHKIIKKFHLKTLNFKNLSNEIIQSLFDTYLVTDGEPADKLWISNAAIQFQIMHGGDLLAQPFKNTSCKFIEFLGQYMSNQQSHDYYDYLLQNIIETQVDINTTGDLFWWINFNFHWVEHLLIWYNLFPNKSAHSYNQYKKYYKPWYNTIDYQLWSLSSQSKTIADDCYELYKMPAKQYIHQLVDDDFYYNYKSKLGSSKPAPPPPPDFVILSDGSRLDHTNTAVLEKFINENCLALNNN